MLALKGQRFIAYIAEKADSMRGQYVVGAQRSDAQGADGRIGHSSTRAAMIYQHATRDRDHVIAAALDALIEEARGKISA
jgi:hypothetical protein